MKGAYHGKDSDRAYEHEGDRRQIARAPRGEEASVDRPADETGNGHSGPQQSAEAQRVLRAERHQEHGDHAHKLGEHDVVIECGGKQRAQELH